MTEGEPNNEQDHPPFPQPEQAETQGPLQYAGEAEPSVDQGDPFAGNTVHSVSETQTTDTEQSSVQPVENDETAEARLEEHNESGHNRVENENLAQYMAVASEPLEHAASVAEHIGRPEKAAELRELADIEAQKGALEYDHDQRREAEAKLIEARIAENERRADEERRQRFEQEVNGLLDKVFDAVKFEPGQSEELFEDTEWAQGYGSEPKIAAVYERLGLKRPDENTEPNYISDPNTRAGVSAPVVGKFQVESLKTYVTPTSFGVNIRETRYKPGPQYDSRSPRILLKVEKPQTPA